MTYAISIKMNFGNNCNDIHPEELEIKKENEASCESLILYP